MLPIPGLAASRCGGGELRDAVIAALRSHLPADAPLRRVPVHVDDDRLFGGLDLVATLAQGRAVQRAGLLVEADRGVLVLAMADRLSDAVAGRIVAAMDGGGDGRCLVVALDDGDGPDERPCRRRCSNGSRFASTCTTRSLRRRKTGRISWTRGRRRRPTRSLRRWSRPRRRWASRPRVRRCSRCARRGPRRGVRGATSSVTTI
ncbi:hypothetical protein [Sphingomonas aerolata]|uniref:hypothetical protein n=1 Tax=Sphingomonas aerolata TaxID=185951 RepID=UPI002FE19CFD